MKLNERVLKELKSEINRLTNEQDRIYKDFLDKYGLEEDKHFEPFLFDYIYNNNERGYKEVLASLENNSND